MHFHLGVEDMEPGNWVIWVFEMPGCYARGKSREEAIALVSASLEELLGKLNQAGFASYNANPPFDPIITEEFRAFSSSSDYLVNAFFENDRIPLNDTDIEYANCLLNLNRCELMSLVSALPNATLDRVIDGEVQMNVRGILHHVGTTEWWYWDRLGMACPRDRRPTELFELLRTMRDFTLQHLPEVVGSTQITTCSGEQWSPRKLLRRTIWHERVHTLQIRRYLSAI